MRIATPKAITRIMDWTFCFPRKGSSLTRIMSWLPSRSSELLTRNQAASDNSFRIRHFILKKGVANFVSGTNLRFKRAHSLSDRANTSVHFLDLNHRLACAQFASQISARLLAPLLYCPSKIVGQATARGSGLHLHIGSAR